MNNSELNLLVVEDDEFQRKLIVNMLRSLGVTAIFEAGDGRQEMDGLEFLRQMSRENHHPSVVVTSALDDMMLSSADRMAKMHGIRLLGTMQKPVTLSYLKDLLAKHE